MEAIFKAKSFENLRFKSINEIPMLIDCNNRYYRLSFYNGNLAAYNEVGNFAGTKAKTKLVKVGK